MKVLIACEFSGIVRDAFAARGHDAWSCDLLPTETPGNHFKDSIFHVLSNTMSWSWDLIIGHPPCTYLCNSGVSWLNKKEGRWNDMKMGAIFFKSLLHSNCDKIAIENPIPHKYALQIIGRKYDQIIQPYYFGDAETKATCLWLKGLPKLVYSKEETLFENKSVVELPEEANKRMRLHYLPPSPERAKLRSKTFPGIAKAMAEQWSGII